MAKFQKYAFAGVEQRPYAVHEPPKRMWLAWSAVVRRNQITVESLTLTAKCKISFDSYLNGSSLSRTMEKKRRTKNIKKMKYALYGLVRHAELQRKRSYRFSFHVCSFVLFSSSLIRINGQCVWR